MHDQTGIALADYLERLGLHLKLPDVPSPQVRQILEEVRAHVLDTGEGPEDAFGAPAAYAQEYAATLAAAGVRQPWLGCAWIARLTLLVMGIYLIRIGIAAGPETRQASVQIPAPVFLWLILLGAGGGLLSRWLIDPFIERQSVQSPRGHGCGAASTPGDRRPGADDIRQHPATARLVRLARQHLVRRDAQALGVCRDRRSLGRAVGCLGHSIRTGPR